ncbi:ATP-binding protein [Shewanella polaris]|uniref:ATP-binding protein n=1 Tax=Shewanella polaris TaxID=2588449 RepID=A0A4Y5YHE5_9GAMM|nr:ATP-binding protein [Shewanella polaris]QDE31966.1 ATP-binding protein [Shewanella polaris]
MKLYISRSDTPVIPAEAQKQITKYISSAVKEAIECEFKKRNIIIVSDERNIYRDACIARSYQVKIQHGKDIVNLGNTALAKSLFIYTLASHREDIQREKVRVFKECKKALSKMPIENLEIIINERLLDSSEQFIQELKSNLFKEKYEIVKSISISSDNKKVKFVDVDYKDDLNHLISMQGIHLFTGERGTGKSQLLMRLFEEAHIDKRYPIYMSASKVLSRSLLKKNDTRHYDLAWSDTFARGALGVMLKLMLDENYFDMRWNSEILIIDELEDVLDLSTSEIVGNGTLEDKKLLLQRLEEQINKSTSVIAADAFINDNTVDWLYELAEKSNKTIFVYRQKSQFQKPLVRVMSYATNLELSNRSVINGEKSGIFSDAQHNKVKSKFEAEIIAVNTRKKKISEDNQKYIAGYTQIDAAFMHSDQASETGDISKLSSSVQMIFYNSAAKNGLSLLDPDYKRVSVLCHGTTAPNDIVQADGRFRFREEVWLSFDKPERRLCTNPLSILVDMINREFSDELTEEMLDEMKRDIHLKRIASRISFKNKMRENYEFTVLTIYEFLGHEIEFFDDKKASIQGNKNRKTGLVEEKAARDAELISAEKIGNVEAQKIMRMGEHINKENKRKLRSFELRNFYKVPVLTSELIDFDRDGKCEQMLRTILLAEVSTNLLTLDEQFKKQLIQRFISTIQLHDNEFRYNNIDAKKFQDFLFDENIEIGFQHRRAIDVFYATFKIANVSSKNALSTITSVLEKELFIKPISAKKKDRQRAYIANMASETKMWLEHIKSETISKSLLVA